VWQNEHQDLNILVMAVDQWDIHHGCEQHKIQEEGRKREGRGKEEGRKREELTKESGLLILVRFPLGFEQCCLQRREMLNWVCLWYCLKYSMISAAKNNVSTSPVSSFTTSSLLGVNLLRWSQFNTRSQSSAADQLPQSVSSSMCHTH